MRILIVEVEKGIAGFIREGFGTQQEKSRKLSECETRIMKRIGKAPGFEKEFLATPAKIVCSDDELEAHGACNGDGV